ncbi:hypothetical protein [Shinella sp.]|uniref:hypothetical protein n=1 Tax=Shinella sp. TaxID=1870904 RepID=UPI00301D3CEB
MWPKDVDRFDPVNATLYLAAAFGLLSAASFVNSAVGVIQTLKIPAPQAARSASETLGFTVIPGF